MTRQQAMAIKARGERAGETVSVMREAGRRSRRITWVVSVNSGRWIAEAEEASDALRDVAQDAYDDAAYAAYLDARAAREDAYAAYAAAQAAYAALRDARDDARDDAYAAARR